MKIGMAFAVGAVLIAIASCGEANKPLAPITAAEVNGEAIIAADQRPGVWLSHGRTYSEQRYSPLKQITGDNVTSLGIAWSGDLDTNRGSAPAFQPFQSPSTDTARAFGAQTANCAPGRAASLRAAMSSIAVSRSGKA